MRLSKACSFGAIFLACVTLFGTCGFAELTDYDCFWFSASLSTHPCSCFLGTGHTPGDKCATGDPTGTFNPPIDPLNPTGPKDAKGLYDLGCTDIAGPTCHDIWANDAYDCGDVILCNQACDWSEDNDGFGGSIPDPGWACQATDKGTCNKRFGGCLYTGA